MKGFTLIAEDADADTSVLVHVADELFRGWKVERNHHDSFYMKGGGFLRLGCFAEAGDYVFYEDDALRCLPFVSPRFAYVGYGKVVDGKAFLGRVIAAVPSIWVDNDYEARRGSDYGHAIQEHPHWPLTGPLPRTS